MGGMRLALALLTACSFHHGAAPGADGSLPGGDGSGIDDAPGDGVLPDGLPCYGTGIIQVCATQQPVMKFEVGSNQGLDTDSQCDGGVIVNQANVCVKIAQQIKISHDLHATGSRPLVLVGTDTIEVGMLLDVSSQAGVSPSGAGALGGACGTNHTPGATGGGPGGSFSGIAGPGGNGLTTAAGTQPRPTLLRGGCPGSNGYGATNGGTPGGGVYLIAGTSITIASGGRIDASGAGGGGGTPVGNGGGGGGSGGMIVFDAPMIMNGGDVFASGGGGGEGGDTATGNPGDQATSSQAGAAGGTNGTTVGGDGGIGSFQTTRAGGAGFGGGGGGGGGGGAAGFILVYGASSIMGAGNIAPPPS